MNSDNKITLRDFIDFIDLLYIPAGLKRSDAKIVLYTCENLYICTTRANSIGVDPYLNSNIMWLKTFTTKEIGYSSAFEIGLDILGPITEENTDDN